MRTINLRITIAMGALAIFLVLAATVPVAQAQSPLVNQEATQILQRMTDYLGSLKQFSVHTRNTVEDELATGNRVDYSIAADVVVKRPNKLRSKRQGDLIDQSFYYDGKTVTLYNAADKVYATHAAPGTIEEMFGFARDSLGLVVPIADLVYRHAYPLLMEDVTLAVVIGKSVIGGVRCDHLLFSRHGVDFQVWVADSGSPLPYKYVVTDTGTPARLSISTVMSEWNEKPSVKKGLFTFTPPKKAKSISFMPFKAY